MSNHSRWSSVKGVIFNVVVPMIFIVWGSWVIYEILSTPKEKAGLQLDKPITIEVKNVYKFHPEDGTNLKVIRNVGLTYYSRKDGMTPGHTTRSGRFVSEGTIAVSQPLWDKEVSAGDCIYVKATDRWYRVEDTMNSKYTEPRIDIYTHDMKLAKSGSSKTEIIIMRQPK